MKAIDSCLKFKLSEIGSSTLLHLSCGLVGVVSYDCSTMELVTHYGAIVLNGTGPSVQPSNYIISSH
jgi:hypothetical protein